MRRENDDMQIRIKDLSKKVCSSENNFSEPK